MAPGPTLSTVFPAAKDYERSPGIGACSPIGRAMALGVRRPAQAMFRPRHLVEYLREYRRVLLRRSLLVEPGRVDPREVCQMKYRCAVCGYVHEGDSPWDECPQCKAPGDRCVLIIQSDLSWAAEHVIGIAKDVDPRVIEGLKNNFKVNAPKWACTLPCPAAADRQGYPEVAEAYKRIAFEEADHASRFAELLGEVVSPESKNNLEMRVEAEYGATAGKWNWRSWPKSSATMPSMTPCTRWPTTRPATARPSRAYSSGISPSRF